MRVLLCMSHSRSNVLCVHNSPTVSLHNPATLKMGSTKTTCSVSRLRYSLVFVDSKFYKCGTLNLYSRNFLNSCIIVRYMENHFIIFEANKDLLLFFQSMQYCAEKCTQTCSYIRHLRDPVLIFVSVKPEPQIP